MLASAGGKGDGSVQTSGATHESEAQPFGWSSTYRRFLTAQSQK